MPKIKTPNLPQINAGQMLYGEIPIELFPAGMPSTQLSEGSGQIAFWDGVQWHMTRIVGLGSLDVSYDAANNVLEFAVAEERHYGSFTTDAILAATLGATLTADADLV